MCGVAGILALDREPLAPAHAERVRAMCAAQKHRGPDDEGVAELGPICLGSVRLSILDLSEAGHMPMSDADGRWWITYNGEVYNYRELRETLQELGYGFRSGTDTEVVLAAFREWGEACLERLTGMFAFAVWDARSQELVLVRDRLGIKPLHYMQRDGLLYFSSEVKAIQRVCPGLAVDRASLAEWAFYQTVHPLSPETLLEDVRTLLPGECLRVRGGEVTTHRYYSPADHVSGEQFQRMAKAGPTALVGRVERCVRESVSLRLVSDVPVGTLLSGGLDSSLVSAMAARERSLTGFHVSVAGSGEHDEKVFAERVARELGFELVSIELSPASFRRELPRAIQLNDAPLMHANSVAYSLICRKAREHGVHVLLSGEGADELFGGYRWRYRRQRTLLRLQGWLDNLPPRVRRAANAAGLALADLPVDEHRFDQLVGQALQLVDRYARKDWRMRCEEAYSFVGDRLDRFALGAMLGDLNGFLGPLLRRLDRMSMGASVECRVPYLDHRVVELGIHLPLTYRLGRRADKWVLKEVAERYLPSALVHRRKMGFPLPLEDYLAPLASEELFRGGFWLERMHMPQRGLRDALASWRRKPHALLGLVTGEIWGRMTFMDEELDEILDRIARLEHAHAR